MERIASTHPKLKERLRAIDALGTAGAVEELLRIAESPGEGLLRTRAIAALDGRASGNEARLLVLLRTAADPEVVRAAIRAMAGSESVSPALEETLRNHPRPGIRAEAAMALLRSDRSRGPVILRRALEAENDPHVRRVIDGLLSKDHP